MTPLKLQLELEILVGSALVEWGQIQSSALSAKSGCISDALELWVDSKRIPHLDADVTLAMP